MKLKKILSVLLVSSMVMSMAACGKNQSAEKSSAAAESKSDVKGSVSGESKASEEETAEEITFPLEETKTYSVFTIMTSGTYDLKDNLVIKTLEEDTNVHLEFESVLPADLTEKKNLLLSSGTYPEILMKTSLSPTEQYEFGSQGILIPLEDLINEYMPNLKAELDERDAWQWITTADGHVYAIPEMEFGYSQSDMYWINKKWMDNLGLKEPANLDELFDVLMKFKEEDANGNGDKNDEYPIISHGNAILGLLQYFGKSAIDFDTYLSVVDGELTYIPTSDTFKEFLAFSRKLYENGLLNENCFTLSGSEEAAIGTSNDVIGSCLWKASFQCVGRGERAADFICLTPFGQGTYSVGTGIKQGALAITDACEDPVTFLTMWDRFYSEEGGIFAFMGVEGISYRIDEKGNWVWIFDGEYGSNITEIRAQATLQGSATVPSMYPDFWYSNMSEEADPDEVYLNKERARSSSYGHVALPALKYNEEQDSRRATIVQDTDSYMKQYMAQVVVGELDLEKSWDEYISTMEAMGSDELFDIYQTAYNEAVSN